MNPKLKGKATQSKEGKTTKYKGITIDMNLNVESQTANVDFNNLEINSQNFGKYETDKETKAEQIKDIEAQIIKDIECGDIEELQ